MNTCKTCKHWTPQSSGPAICEKAGEDTLDPLPLAESDAFVVSCEGHGCLCTGPDFGCIRHEPIE